MAEIIFTRKINSWLTPDQGKTETDKFVEDTQNKGYTVLLRRTEHIIIDDTTKITLYARRNTAVWLNQEIGTPPWLI